MGRTNLDHNHFSPTTCKKKEKKRSLTTPSDGEDVGLTITVIYVFGKQFNIMKLNIHITYDTTVPFLPMYPRESLSQTCTMENVKVIHSSTDCNDKKQGTV